MTAWEQFGCTRSNDSVHFIILMDNCDLLRDPSCVHEHQVAGHLQGDCSSLPDNVYTCIVSPEYFSRICCLSYDSESEGLTCPTGKCTHKVTNCYPLCGHVSSTPDPMLPTSAPHDETSESLFKSVFYCADMNGSSTVIPNTALPDQGAFL